MSFVRKTLQRIYPAYDELTIYSMALAIGFLALLNRQFAELLIHGLYLVFIVGTASKFESGWWDGTMHLLGMSILVIVTAFGLIASIWLPFTRRRFDHAVGLIIMAHCIMMCTANFIAAERDGDPWNYMIALGSLFWFLGYCACLRYNWIVEWVSRREASRKEAMIAGASIFGAVVLSSLILRWHWATCYAFSFASALTITQTLQLVLGDEQEPGASQSERAPE